jgi:hypothetical protein
MKSFLTCDIDWESKVDKVRSDLADAGFSEFLAGKDYGPGLQDLAIVLMCQRSDLNLKQRIRYSKANASISMDIMLDLESMKAADMPMRRRIVASHLYAEVPRVVAKYAKYGIDVERFTAEFQAWVANLGWLVAGSAVS